MPILGLAVLALLPVAYRKLVGPVSRWAAVGDVPGQGSESGLQVWSVKIAADSGASLPAFPDKPPKAAPIRDPGAGAATAGGCSGIGALALDPGSARFALVRESRTRGRSLLRRRRS